jgi:2-oxoglutarate dehydrogenase E2 component (dihydrolipoamide succinyltransferase)
MAIIQVKVPSFGESVTEVTLLRWAKSSGQAVNSGEAVAEVETDKANSDLFADQAGAITTIANPGDVLKIGAVIATIDTEAKGAAAAPASAPATPTPAATTTPVAAPASGAKLDDLPPGARRAAVENKVDPATVTGTGRGGRVTKEDIEKTAEKVPAAPQAPVATTTPAVPVAAVAPVAKKPEVVPQAVVVPGEYPVRRMPMTKIRKRIAETLVKSKSEMAQLTTFNEIDLTQVMALRTKYKEVFEKKFGVGLGFMSFFAKAVIAALGEFERVNGRIDGDDIVYHDYVNLGVAVSTERGLIVPTIRHAERLSMAQIESEIKRLAISARDNKLAPDELSGGTFTITNGGVFGSLLSTPIVNYPQSAILGMHTIQQRPVAIDGKVEIRPMMYVALSYDHRIIDGKESVSFLVKVKTLLEDPARLLLSV